jgi:4-amino-4-deoxy-L-arabinose transferase-like glycosyltransferase
MAALISLIVLALLILLIANLRPDWGWRRSALRSSLFLSGGAILVFEALSIVALVNQASLIVVWVLVFLILLFLLIRVWRSAGKLQIPRLITPSNWATKSLLLGVVIILVFTGVIAWFAPPHNWEALRYHMVRVSHWAQNQSIGHFATGIEIQNSMPPAAEYLVLNTYLLTGGDQLVNFVSWFAMMGSVLGVSLVAQQLGASTRGQVLASVFTATLPMGIIQASSTMNDYVLAFWLICLASEALTYWRGNDAPWAAVFLGISTGLALLTKGTAIAYILPFGLLVLFVALKDRSWREKFHGGALALSMILILNAGHLLRSVETYGQPVSIEQVNLHRNEILNPQVVASNLVRNVGLHASTPSPHVNKGSTLLVFRFHELLGLSPNDPRTTNHSEFRIQDIFLNEDRAGNPFHMVLILFTTAWLIAKSRDVPKLLWVYWGLVIGTFLLLSVIFKWQIFGSRYHLGFFALYAPVFGFTLSRYASIRVGTVAGILMILLAFHPILFMEDKPLLSLDRNNGQVSILASPRTELYFTAQPSLADPMREIAQTIHGKKCKTIGLSLSGSAAEYPWWILLGAPDENLLIEWLVAGAPSDIHALEEFSPCAVICDKACPDHWTMVHGLPLASQRAGFRLFMLP